MIDLDEVHLARKRLGQDVRHTPLLSDDAIDRATGATVTIKAEHLQYSGSFKYRGILNRMRKVEGDLVANGALTVSAGNAGRAVARAAELIGASCTVVVPDAGVQTKLDAIAAHGATLVKGGPTAKDMFVTVDRLKEESSRIFIHPFDDDDVVAGHATAGLELLEDLPAAPDILLVPTSGGGLLSAMALAVKTLSPSTKVIGVQPVAADGVFKSFRSGQREVCERPDTIADGLTAPGPGVVNLELILAHVDDVLLVQEDAILQSMALIWRTFSQAVEPSGATALAALLAPGHAFEGQDVAVMASGANVNLALLAHAVAGGSIAEWKAQS